MIALFAPAFAFAPALDQGHQLQGRLTNLPLSFLGLNPRILGKELLFAARGTEGQIHVLVVFVETLGNDGDTGEMKAVFAPGIKEVRVQREEDREGKDEKANYESEHIGSVEQQSSG